MFEVSELGLRREDWAPTRSSSRLLAGVLAALVVTAGVAFAIRRRIRASEDA